MKLYPYLLFIIALSPIICFAEDAPSPVKQDHLNALVEQNKALDAFLEAFEAGDELTEFSFDASRGVGANIGEGRRFTRFSRADLNGPQEWANHFPKREGGANATSCIACHNAPFANGAGDVALNVVVDPAHTGDPSKLAGIDADPVIRPFGWKGNHATIRAFTRGAAHNELGLQAVELVGDNDGDFDGVTQELTVGDMTALTLYMAALERPASRLELADIGLSSLENGERDDILAGEDLFSQTGCASCHTPSMTLEDPIFSEPSKVAGFYDVTFPDGSDPASHGLSDASALTFDLSKDQPNNRLTLPDGTAHHLGALETDDGAVIARWYTDFKRHDMGSALSDPDDPLGLGASKFLTRSLAGVGVTGPWLHDGRATTLDEAIRAHGGDAAQSTQSYIRLSQTERAQIVSFLENLVMHHEGEEE